VVLEPVVLKVNSKRSEFIWLAGMLLVVNEYCVGTLVSVFGVSTAIAVVPEPGSSRTVTVTALPALSSTPAFVLKTVYRMVLMPAIRGPDWPRFTMNAVDAPTAGADVVRIDIVDRRCGRRITCVRIRRRDIVDVLVLVAV
jgi:hypothetical protein